MYSGGETIRCKPAADAAGIAAAIFVAICDDDDGCGAFRVGENICSMFNRCGERRLACRIGCLYFGEDGGCGIGCGWHLQCEVCAVAGSTRPVDHQAKAANLGGGRDHCARCLQGKAHAGFAAVSKALHRA